jgi:hypothetical protein
MNNFNPAAAPPVAVTAQTEPPSSTHPCAGAPYPTLAGRDSLRWHHSVPRFPPDGRRASLRWS